MRTFPKSNIKTVKRGKMDSTNSQLHDRSLFGLGTSTSIKSGWVKLLLWILLFCQIFLFVTLTLSMFQFFSEIANDNNSSYNTLNYVKK